MTAWTPPGPLFLHSSFDGEKLEEILKSIVYSIAQPFALNQSDFLPISELLPDISQSFSGQWQGPYVGEDAP